MPFLSVETCSLEASISRNTVTVSAFTVASVAAVGTWERWPKVKAGKQKTLRANRKTIARCMGTDCGKYNSVVQLDYQKVRCWRLSVKRCAISLLRYNCREWRIPSISLMIVKVVFAPCRY